MDEAELRGLLGQMQEKLKATEQQLQKQIGKNEVVVHNTRERKVVKFKEGDDISEWLSTIKPYINNRFTTEIERVSFLMDNLDKTPKLEIRFRIDIQKASSGEVIGLLEQIYGVKETLIELQQQFFSRNQEETESLDEYSHVLMEQLLVLKAKEPRNFHNQDEILKQKFAAGVLDISLRRHLKNLNADQSDLKFFQLRNRADEWLKDETKSDILQSSSASVQTSLLSTMKETIHQQQQQLDTLQQHILSNNHNQSHRGSYSSRSRGRSTGRSTERYQDNGHRRQFQSTQYSYPRNRSMGHHDGNNDDRETQFQRRNYNQYPVEGNSNSNFSQSKNSRSPIICDYCGELNHIYRNCMKRIRDQRRGFDSYQPQKPRQTEQFHQTQPFQQKQQGEQRQQRPPTPHQQIPTNCNHSRQWSQS